MYSKMQSILCELDLVPTKLNRLISTGIKRVTSGSLTQFPVKNRVSGVEIDGEIRDAVYISQGGIEGIVFGINNKELKFYRFQK